ncbi:FecR family protein [Arcticibacter sp. MXS-1]|uniref:FecR family protein n=1 Tax=Arcticibacter sp. MXS-1 TaxID=3341726 RepID=UPI0035A8DEB0
MSENKVFLIKLVQYLNDPSEPGLKEEVEHWRRSAEENEQFFHQISDLWHMSGELKDLDMLDPGEAVGRLSRKMGYETHEARGRGVRWYSGVAAALALLVLGYWAFHSFTYQRFLTRTTGSLIDTVVLSDGSLVYLAAHSTVRYPQELKGEKRELTLIDGEAFFEVKKDPEHPFVVHIDSSVVTVLGTSFNIRNTHEEVNLNVRTGKVRFDAPDNKSTSILTAGDGLTYWSKTGQSRVFKDAGGGSYGWLTHELSFVDAPLNDVFQSLEKYYRVTFRVSDSLSSYSKFNARFRDNSLDEVLEILKETYSLDFSRQGEVVTVRSK